MKFAKCKWWGCNNNIFKSSFCEYHYTRHRKKANEKRKRRKEVGLCRGCNKNLFKWDLCEHHYELEKQRRITRSLKRICPECHKPLGIRKKQLHIACSNKRCKRRWNKYQKTEKYKAIHRKAALAYYHRQRTKNNQNYTPI